MKSSENEQQLRANKELKKKIKQLESYKIEYDELCSQLSVLDDFVRKETARHAETRAALEASQQQNHALQAEVSQLTARCKAQDVQKQHQEKLRKDVEKTIDLLKQREEEVEQQAGDTQAKYDALLKEKAILEEQLNLNDQRSKDYLERFGAETELAMSAASALQEEVTKLRVELGQRDTDLALMQAKTEDVRREKEKLEKAEATSSAGMQRLRNELSEARQTFQEDMDKMRSEMARLIEVEKVYEELKLQAEALKKELNSERKKSKHSLQRYEGKMGHLSQEYEVLLRDAEKVHKKEMKQMNLEHERELAEARERFSQDLEVKELHLQKQNLEAEERWKQQIADVENFFKQELSKQKKSLESKFHEEQERGNKFYQTEITSLKRKLSKTYHSLEETQKEREKWKQDTERELCLLEERIKREKVIEKQRLSTMQEVLDDMEKRALAAEEEAKKLRRDCQSTVFSEKMSTGKLHEEIGALKSLVQEKDASIQRLKLMTGTTSEALKEKEDQISELKKQLQSSDVGLSLAMKDKESELESLKAEIERWKTKEAHHSEIVKTCKMQQETIGLLKNKLDKEKKKLKSKTKVLAETVEAQEEDLNRLHIENERLDENYHTMKQELDYATRKYDELQQQVEIEQDRQKSLREYRQQLAKDRAELETQLCKEVFTERSRNLILQQKLACVSKK